MEICYGEPRAVERLHLVCEQLAAAWAQLPDWRFGQLMVNLMREYEAEHGRDFFFLEEDEMIKVIEVCCEHFSGGTTNDR